jgi:WD40 repeat protein
MDLAWSPDGSMLAMAGGDSQRMIVWDAATGETIYMTEPLGEFPLSAVQFSPSGDVVALSGKTGTWIFDTDTWSEIAFHVHTGTPSWVLIFTPDGNRLISAQAHTGDLRVFDAADWAAEPLLISVAPGQTRDMALSSGGRLVALAANDGLVHVVELDTGELLHVLPWGEGEITNIEFIDADAHLLITPGIGDAVVLTLDTEELVAAARDRVTRSFTASECQTYRIRTCPTEVEETESEDASG